jgi:hypothetical protein
MAPKIKRYADSTEVREWATKLTDKEKKDLGIEGIEVSQRGRFHSDLVRAFNRIHRNDGIRYVPIGRTQPRRDDVFEDADQGDDDRPTTYRQPRQQPTKDADVHELPQQATLVAQQPMVMAMPGAPEPVMELLRAGHNVIVVYVPLPMQAAV